MSNFSVSIDLLENNTEIGQKILQAISKKINNIIVKKIDTIQQKISLETVNYLKTTNTYFSLIDGELAGHFGLPPTVRKSYVDNILNKIGSNIEVNFKKFVIRNKNISGYLQIDVLINNFSDILSMLDSTIMTERGVLLNWLQWLLLEGDRVIVSQHEIMPSIQGRSKKMIMIKSNAGVWRVPPEFSGVQNDNWLTRAILNSGEYLKIIEKIIETEII